MTAPKSKAEAFFRWIRNRTVIHSRPELPDTADERASMSFPEEDVWDKINESWSRMSFKQRFLWEAIKRPPEEWELRGYGKFWVVALMGSTVIYYNHHEHGFNPSPWHQYGYLVRYESMQYGLEEAVQRQLEIITTGYDVGPWGSPPIPGEYEK